MNDDGAASSRSRAAGRAGERPRARAAAPSSGRVRLEGPPSGGHGKGERRRRRRRVRREPATEGVSRPRRAAFWATVELGILVAAAASALLVVYPERSGPGTGKNVVVTIDPEEPRGSVASKLAAGGLVRSAGGFGVYANLVGARFAPGEHLLTDDASPGELVRRMERAGAASRAKVTIPEGWNRFDIGRRLEALHVATATSFLRATTDPELLRELSLDGDSAEGFLFPATYELPKDSDPRDVVRRMKSEFDRRFHQLEQTHRLGLAQLENAHGWNRRHVVTLASMVEKEAAVDEERPIIASVFLNRLKDPSFKRKVLQCDPTSGYGCLVLGERVPACAGYSGKITHAINVDPLNTYSTYVHEGLPPGPIGNPGVASLRAVLAPATTRYLYFVAREGRRHAFSETLEDHNTAVKDYRERTSRDRDR